MRWQKYLQLLIGSCLLSILLPTCTRTAWTNGAVEQRQNLEAISSLPIPDIPYDVAVSGSYIYLAAGEKGLLVMDITNPATPKIVHAVNMPGSATAVAVAGNYAYVADTNGGLQIVDISNPPAASIVSSVTDAGMLLVVAVSGSYAYAADTAGGLHIIDISSSRKPKIRAYCKSPDGSPISFVAVNFPYAYITYGYRTGILNNGGFSVIDVSDPLAPKPVSQIRTRQIGNDISLSGGYAFIAGGDLKTGGFQIIDISNPASPKLAGYVDCPFVAGSLEIKGNRAFVTCRGLLTLDISDKFSPYIVDTTEVKGFARDVALSDDFYLVGTFNISSGKKSGSLQIMAQSDIVRIPADPVFVDLHPVRGSDIAGLTYPDSSVFSPLAVSGNIICATKAGTDGKVLQVLDSTGASFPAAPATLELPGKAKDIVIWKKRALVAADRLYIIDLSNPARPVLTGSVKGIERPCAIEISGSYAYVVNGYGLKIIDLKSRGLDKIVGSVDTPYSARDVAVTGNLACVADGAGLQLIDVSKKKAPGLAGSLIYEWAMAVHVAVKGKFAYLSDRSGFITIIDIGDITNPVAAGTIPMPEPIGVMAVSGSDLYVSMFAESRVLEILDIAAQEKPKVIAKMGRPGTKFFGGAVATSGSRIFVNDAREGLLTGSLPGTSRKQAHIATNPLSWSISCEAGLGTNAEFTLANSGDAPLSYSISSDVEWLQIKPCIGGVPEKGTIPVTASLLPRILPEGRHKAKVIVADPAADNSPFPIEVTVDVTPPTYHAIKIEPESLSLKEVRPGTSATVTLTSEGPFKILSASASFKWIRVERDSENADLRHTISIIFNKTEWAKEYKTSNDTIKIVTDNPGQQKITVPLRIYFAHDEAD